MAIPFKGPRDYISGTDIVAELVRMANSTGSISVQMHRMASRPLFAFWTNEPGIRRLRSEKALCALMSYRNDGCDERLIAVVEDLGGAGVPPVPFDEDAICGDCAITGNLIVQEVSSGGNFFERIVALNKVLLNNIIETHKWIFCGLNVLDLPENDTPIQIQHSTQIGNNLRRSSIKADGKVIESHDLMRQPKLS